MFVCADSTLCNIGACTFIQQSIEHQLPLTHAAVS